MKKAQELALKIVIYFILNILTNTSKPLYYALLLTISHEIALQLYKWYIERDITEE